MFELLFSIFSDKVRSWGKIHTSDNRPLNQNYEVLILIGWLDF